jgi:hypothetical protein
MGSNGGALDSNGAVDKQWSYMGSNGVIEQQ